jgi:hypothetical protein
MLKPIAQNVVIQFPVKKNKSVKPVEKIVESNPYFSKHSDWSRNIIIKGQKIDTLA